MTSYPGPDCDVTCRIFSGQVNSLKINIAAPHIRANQLHAELVAHVHALKTARQYSFNRRMQKTDPRAFHRCAGDDSIELLSKSWLCSALISMAALRITGRAARQLWPLNSNFYIAHPPPSSGIGSITTRLSILPIRAANSRQRWKATSRPGETNVPRWAGGRPWGSAPELSPISARKRQVCHPLLPMDRHGCPADPQDERRSPGPWRRLP